MEDAKKLYDLVEKTPIIEATADELIEQNCKVDDKENNPESWNKMFREKKIEFLDFLKTPIDMNLPIEASV